MKLFTRVFLLFILFVMANIAGAVEINGGVGLTHTKAAWVAKKGYLTVLPHTRFWGKVSENDNETEEGRTAVTYWDVQGLLSINYGISEHFSFNITPILYQDINQGEYDEYPWDTFIGLKIGSYGAKESPFKFGMELATRFPTGEKHNVVFEDYTAGSAEWGFTALASYALDRLFPEDGLNAHLNLGYWNHNDVGQNLAPDSLLSDEFKKIKSVLDPSQAFRYAIGVEFPTESFNYALEIYGNSWIQKPPELAASREGYTYLNASIKYKPYRWFDFIVSGDIRISGDRDDTIGPRASRHDLPNYSSWRINVGAKFVILPTSVYQIKERDILMRKAETRREVFEQIIKEKKDTESAEQELERIKQEREKAEKELDRLKRILEGKEQVPPPDSENQKN